jgi:hypothetical protein
MADHRWSERAELDPQVGRNPALIRVLLEHQHRGRFRPIRQPALQALKVSAQAPLVDPRQRQPFDFELD